MRDKQWRTRVGSEGKRSTKKLRGRNPITWETDEEERRTQSSRDKRRNNAAMSVASNLMGGEKPAPKSENASPANSLKESNEFPKISNMRAHEVKRMTTAMATEAAKKTASELMKAKFKEQQAIQIQERQNSRKQSKTGIGRPPLAERKPGLTALKLKQLEKAQAQQAKRLGLMSASSRSSARNTTARSTSRSRSSSRSQGGATQRSTISSVSARSSSSSGGRGNKTGRSTASWSSKLSIDSRTSNLTEKAMDRIAELEMALERERKLRQMAEQELSIASLPSSRASSETGRRSTARSARR